MASERSRGGSVEKYTALSRRLIRQAQEEIKKGDRVQASEKAWGAAAHAVKAAAERRGWNHYSHRLLFDVVDQLARDAEAPELLAFFRDANSLHQNFYEDWQSDSFVQDGINRVGGLLDTMDELAAQPLRQSVVVDGRQWRRLTQPPPE